MACLNRICMNIIKEKCIGNKNLLYVGNSYDYDVYINMIAVNHYDIEHTKLLNREEYTFLKTWINKKPRIKKEQG